MLKVKNGLQPSCFKEIFDSTPSSYNLRNNDSNIPRFNTAFVVSNSLPRISAKVILQLSNFETGCLHHEFYTIKCSSIKPHPPVCQHVSILLTSQAELALAISN